MSLLYNDIIEIEREVILDHSILNPLTICKECQNFVLLSAGKKLFFCAQWAEQGWLRCCYHFIGLCRNRWLMQSIFCLVKAHEAI